ncbi:MFS transporter [Sphaerisporangium krabiense]|uniref:MFS family permease n=2 Tax=Sphaerisporangium krabiense TaxID=763782 RepID=A0A7W9DMH9_9ACTN|nr:MFS transporter [Sphaerisporangium krabiense]MBB5624352.1 MFS family permease [Sphaerisporangium krabiense]
MMADTLRDTSPPRRPSRFGLSALAPDFPMLWGATTVSLLGNGISSAALPLLAASLSSDPIVVSSVVVVGRLPWLLFALPAGVMADRWDRKRAMWISDLVRAGLTAGLAVAVATGSAGIALLMVVGFLIAIADTVFDSSSTAVLPRVVANDPVRIQRANSWLVGSRNTVESFVGPPLGGLLFTMSRSLPFLGDALSFLVSAVLLRRMRGDYHVARNALGDGGMRRAISEGFSFLWRQPVLRAITGIAGLFNVASLAQNAIFVLFAQQLFGLGALGFSLLLAAGSLGALFGAAQAGRLNRWFGTAVSLRLALVVSGVSCLVTASAPNPWFAAAGEILAGLGAAIWNVNQMSLRQAGTPDHLLGRVTGVHRLVTYGAMPFGALLGGVLASLSGLRTSFVVAGAIMLALAVFAGVTITRSRVAELTPPPADSQTA